MPRTRTTAERGSGPVTLLLVLAFLVMMFTAGLTALGTFASNERSGAQHAADAAALAGAQAVVDGLPLDLAPGFLTTAEIPLLLGGGGCVATGRLEASQLASQNHATLSRYCYDVSTDEVSVEVELDGTQTEPQSGTHARAEASAATTFQAQACSFDPGFDPGDVGVPPTDDAPAAPPVRTWLDCGFGRLTVVLDPLTGRFQFLQLAGLPELLTPKLVS